MAISDYYKFSALATASYVRMGGRSLDGATFAEEAANAQRQAGGRLPTEQARYLFDPANNYGAPVWDVISYYGNDVPQFAQDKSGFGATLFQKGTETQGDRLNMPTNRGRSN